MSRREVIAALVLQHVTQPGAVCACGHLYALGELTSHHKADAIDVGLTLIESGVEPHSIIDAVNTALIVSGRTRLAAQG